MAGGGIGEAMLISAVTGAGTAAVTGGDPLKGALLGAATGGIGHGIAGAGAAGGAGATGGASSAGATAATDLATQTAATDLATSGLTNTQQALLSSGMDPAQVAANTGGGTLAPMQQGISGFPGPGPATGDLLSVAGRPPSELGNLSNQIASGPQSFGPDSLQAAVGDAGSPMFPRIAEMSKSGYFYPGLGMAAGAIGAGPETNMPEEEEYSGPLSRFRFDPDKYRRGMRSGGLMDTEPARRMAAGGLGSYSDGGQMLKGPGDGMSDDIPASIGDEQPARLADGEFVVPADVVSGIGNGSTDAGAEALYAMLDRVRKARTGRTEQAPEIDAQRMMPA
jgi:hypothetical protein